MYRMYGATMVALITIPGMRRFGAAFLLLTLTGLVCGDEGSAVATLEKLGAKIKRDETKPGKPVIELNLYGTLVPDAALAHLKDLKSLQSLYLDGTAVTDTGLAHLKDLKSLQSLYLRDTKVTDTGLAHLKDLKSLQTLDLAQCTAVTGAGLAHLKDLKSLQSLYLSNTLVPDAALARLKEFKSLHLLELYKTAVTDAGVSDLKKALPDCEILR